MKDQPEGAYSKIPCFNGVATEAMPIAEIKPQGEDIYSGAFQIMTLTPGTGTDKIYMYLTADDAEGVDGIAEPGWFNDQMDTRLVGDESVTFEPGEGFIVLSEIPGTVTFAGEVAKGDTITELAAGANFVGNNALQPLDIENVIVGTQCDEKGSITSPEEDGLYSGAFQIMTLTPGTGTDKIYMYLLAEDAEGVDGVAEAGWFNDQMDTRLTGDAKVTFPSGEGFLLMNELDFGFIKIAGNVFGE